MSPKLPLNNAQTITDFLNLQKSHIDENDSANSYKFAFDDEAFLARRETLGLRFQLELLKPEILLHERGIDHTITVFGSTRFISHDEAMELDKNAKTPEERDEAKKALNHCKYYDSAREFENGDKTIGFNISLPREQHPNPYVSEGLSFRFHYFALRKMHFMLRARAIVAYPGGFGSFDELFEVVTLLQTKKVVRLPIILVGKDFWTEVINFKKMLEHGVIERTDLDLIHFVETAESAWDIIRDWYQLT
jgi:uncharacterized protein (TIGR00730 family)